MILIIIKIILSLFYVGKDLLQLFVLRQIKHRCIWDILLNVKKKIFVGKHLYAKGKPSNAKFWTTPRVLIR